MNGMVARSAGRLLGHLPLKRYMKSATLALYPVLPGPAKKIATAIDVAIASRPRLYVDTALHPPSRLQRGAVTISLDFEMAWGWQYALVSGSDCVKIGLHEREQVPRILDLMEEYMVPATWATVGHLFLERCSRDPSGLAHPRMPRPPHFRNVLWRFQSGDWYQFDPCADVYRSPAWYAPDLIARILSSKAGHEVGCHTFSHIGFGGYCPPDVAEAEIDACVTAMSGFGLAPRTCVFPGNQGGYHDMLRRRGVERIRSFPVGGNLISLPVLLSDGLWAVPVSSSIRRGRTWSTEQRLRRLKRFVDKAAAERLSMHLWFHPSLCLRDLEEILFPFLRHCADRRDQGMIDILTIEKLVKTTDAAHQSGIRYS